jgi:hypothetical protein
MRLFGSKAPAPAAPTRLARATTGWLQSPYAQRAAVCIDREIDRLVVLHLTVDGDGGRRQEEVYVGRSAREATAAANELLHTLRLRGFRARHATSSDASFVVGDVCRDLDVALS